MLEMKYFILKPKAKGKGDVFARASQEAMIRYADIIREIDIALSDDLLEWASKESLRQSQLASA